MTLATELASSLTKPLVRTLAGLESLNLADGGKIVTLGDSIAAQLHGLDSAVNQISADDIGNAMNRVQSMLGFPFVYNVRNDYFSTAGDDSTHIGHNLGVGGATFDDVLDTQLPIIESYATPPAIVRVTCGTNDIERGDSAATILAKVDEVYTRVNALGAKLWLDPVRPRNSTDGVQYWGSGSYVSVMLAVNAGIKSRGLAWQKAKTGFSINAFSVYNNGSNDAKTGYTRDGLHPSCLGAEAEANIIVPFLLANGITRDFTREWETTAFNASTAPYGNHLAYMDGTGGGTNDTGSTGTVCANYRSGAISAGALSAVNSIVPAPDGGSDYWQKIVITSDGTGVGEENWRFRPNPTTQTNTVSGEFYLMQYEVIIESPTTDLFKNATIFGDDSTDGRKVYGGFVGTGQPALDGGEHTVKRTAQKQVLTSGAIQKWEARIRLDGAVSGSITVYIGRCTFKRLSTHPSFD